MCISVYQTALYEVHLLHFALFCARSNFSILQSPVPAETLMCSAELIYFDYNPANFYSVGGFSFISQRPPLKNAFVSRFLISKSPSVTDLALIRARVDMLIKKRDVGSTLYIHLSQSTGSHLCAAKATLLPLINVGWLAARNLQLISL